MKTFIALAVACIVSDGVCQQQKQAQTFSFSAVAVTPSTGTIYAR